jgi:hypothetical protein
MDSELQDAWKNRARSAINVLPVVGIFTDIPTTINNKDLILQSLNEELNNMARVLHGAVKRVPKYEDSRRWLKFGSEGFMLHSQVYRSISVSYLLRTVLFGKDFCRFKMWENAYETDKILVVHLASKERVDCIFTCNGMNLLEVDDRRTRHRHSTSKFGTAGKVCLKVNNMQAIGFIMSEEEERNYVVVKLLNSQEVTIDRPHYDFTINRWMYGDGDNLLYYWPIRIRINKVSGKCDFTLNRLRIDDNSILH